MEVAKHLSFDDVSVTLPDLRLQAMETEEQLAASDYARILSDLAERPEAFRRLKNDAVERASGCSQAELGLLKDDIDRLKGTAAELCAEGAFMEAIKENRPLPSTNYVDDLKKNGDGKKHRDAVESLKQEIGRTAEAIVGTLEQFEAGVSLAREELRGVESAQSMAASLCAGPSEYDALLREVEAERRALEAAEARERGLSERLAARQRERSAAEQELAPFEAQIAEKLEEARALEAKQAGERKAHDTQKRVEGASLYNSELCALLRGLSGVELLRVSPGALLLRVSAAGGEHELDLSVEGATVTSLSFQAADSRLAGLEVADLVGAHASVTVDEVRARIAQAASGWN